jgi:hypothetical protein
MAGAPWIGTLGQSYFPPCTRGRRLQAAELCARQYSVEAKEFIRRIRAPRAPASWTARSRATSGTSTSERAGLGRGGAGRRPVVVSADRPSPTDRPSQDGARLAGLSARDRAAGARPAGLTRPIVLELGTGPTGSGCPSTCHPGSGRACTSFSSGGHGRGRRLRRFAPRASGRCRCASSAPRMIESWAGRCGDLALPLLVAAACSDGVGMAASARGLHAALAADSAQCA